MRRIPDSPFCITSVHVLLISLGLSAQFEQQIKCLLLLGSFACHGREGKRCLSFRCYGRLSSRGHHLGHVVVGQTTSYLGRPGLGAG